jgi:hypothetical protein
VPTDQIVVLVVVALLVVAVVAAALAASRRKKRSEQLRGTFGSEYDRTLEQAESRKAAERELAARQERHAQLEIRPLSAGSRQRYVEAWGHVQSRFVDEPVLALTEADALVTRLMAERGFPTDGPDEQAAMLSVQHRHVLDSFRAGHAIEERNSTRSANTEEVRQGMLHFRAVFEGLMEDGADGRSGAADEPGPARDDARDGGRDDAPGPDPVRVERADRDADLAQSRLHDGRPAVVVRDQTAPGAAGTPPGGGSSAGGPLRPIVPPGSGETAPREGEERGR